MMPGSRRAIARRRAVALAALCGVVALAVLAISGGGGDSRAGRSAPRFLRVSLGGRVLAQRHLKARGEPGRSRRWPARYPRPAPCTAARPP